ncbi:two-component regulator propeller domain-containing protein [Inhella gelatinilytica]|uniref:histidine kinase n=1 Tax=Inhella gelatinilytica TaxID=2795030 RepID=A0A931NDG9_9BURK|nr:two-component regulator propeller domain-containing protein [Inhella gelatinilytica]MBH9551436.1 GAF domain-containing protein [Inhella gelatinilytica]
MPLPRLFRRIWFALVLVLAAAHGAGAAPTPFRLAEPYLETVGDAESIPFGVVVSLTQDTQGFLWIGTQVGLVRYDGYRFRLFKHHRDDPHSLPGDFINSLWAAPDGRLWVGTLTDGLAVYDPRSERFTRYVHNPAQLGSVPASRINALVTDARGSLWVGTDQGLGELPAGATAFTVHRLGAAGPQAPRIQSLLLDRDGRLWVGTDQGLQVRRATGFEPVPLGAGASTHITQLFQAQDGQIWLGSEQRGAARLQPGTGAVHWLAAGAGPQAVQSIAQPRDGVMALGGRDGLYFVTADRGLPLQKMQRDLSRTSGLALDDVRAQWVDRAGLHWIGTWGGGLQRNDRASSSVRMLRGSAEDGRLLSHADVHSVLPLPSGEILLGLARGGIDRIDRERGRVGGQRPGISGLDNGLITGLASGPDGSLWAATRNQGVQRLRPGSARWDNHSLAQGLPDHRVARLLWSRQSELWVATWGGLARWRGEGLGFETLTLANGEPMRSRIDTLAEDSAGRVWAGTEEGLVVWEPEAKALRRIRSLPLQQGGLLSDDVNGLLVDRQGRLWVDTRKGLQRLKSWDGERAEFEDISTQVGRPGQYFGGNLLEDAEGRIWTQWFVLNREATQAQELGRADGLDLGTPWVGSYAKTDDGLLMFGGTQGVAIIDPAQFRRWAHHPPVVATEIRVDGAPLPAMLPAQGLVLQPQQRSFAVEYAALDYSAPQRLRYRHRLEGYDKDWVDTNAGQRSAHYGELPPGRYTLRVQGSNRLGEWSPHELTIPVEILPAFWQTAGFAVALGLAAFGALTAGWRWRTQRLRQRQRQLEQQVAERTADLVQLEAIGQGLTASLDLEQIFQRLHEQVAKRLDVDVFGIGSVDERVQVLRMDYVYECGVRLAPVNLTLSDARRAGTWCVRQRKELVTAQRSDLLAYLGHVPPVVAGVEMQSCLYLPLVMEDQVLGCLTVQSRRIAAFSAQHLDFLRALANYTAIAVANGLSLRRLMQAQSRLVQSEKMASLGQLVASVAHEINTPIGAIKSSGAHIHSALTTALAALPALIRTLDDDNLRRFFGLVEARQQHRGMRSSREERAVVRQLTRTLTQHGLPDPDHTAQLLVDLQAESCLDEALPLLRLPQGPRVIALAHSLGTVISGTDNINVAIERVSKIVFALKTFSRSSSDGALEFSDVAAQLGTVLTLYQSVMRHGVELVQHVETVPPLWCQADALNQVWTNLIHNALQAMHHRGTLTLTLRQHGDELQVTVQDTGSGIPPDILPRIFEPFFTTRPSGEGSGLGLDIVRQIVAAHDGRIEVQSTVGVGTVFTVHLPLRQPTQAPDATP